MTREEAIEILTGRYLVPVDKGADEYADKVNKALDIAIEALSGEVKTRSETKTGEWIDKGNWLGIECSRCKCHSRYVTPFCPQCGARMVNDET